MSPRYMLVPCLDHHSGTPEQSRVGSEYLVLPAPLFWKIRGLNTPESISSPTVLSPARHTHTHPHIQPKNSRRKRRMQHSAQLRVWSCGIRSCCCRRRGAWPLLGFLTRSGVALRKTGIRPVHPKSFRDEVKTENASKTTTNSRSESCAQRQKASP